MTQCKPCITIRNVLKLLWKNYVIDATKNFKEECKSYSRINATVCELDKPRPLPTFDGEMKILKKIREQAMENYDPEAWDKINQGKA